ncbi:hypothetical protein AAIH36_33805, partial [Pseudomonas aeruginosa]|uniref:hypothetical protein n=1 Tax=Pseudomonas aeruginosa TaxID=287 RepID=UPI0031B72AA4
MQTNGTAYTTEDGKTYSCRASYHIMMTDGIWNGRNVTPGNLDNQNQTFPDSTLYRPQPIEGAIRKGLVYGIYFFCSFFEQHWLPLD